MRRGVAILQDVQVLETRVGEQQQDVVVYVLWRNYEGLLDAQEADGLYMGGIS